ncbi:MAG TPA: VOC family protein [Pseudogracilibacillus sp.]|nr:VOC family protein [Pseudogracilibacillus sp.]
MIKGIWHTSFTVENIERTIDFYENVLGLKLVNRQTQNNEYTRKLVAYEDAHLKVAMFDIAGLDTFPSGHVLEFVEYVKPEGEYVPKGTAHTRSAHVAFVVSDIHEIVERLKEKGVRFKSEVVSITEGINKGGYTVYFWDPDEITLELVQPPKERSI